MFNILLIVFVSVFIITAILTILSIPEWIKIPEWYKKKLFTALILEVIAVVILLAKETFFDNSSALKQAYVSLDATGKLIPYITDDKGDTIYISDFYKEGSVLELDSYFDKEAGALYIKDKSGDVFGKVPLGKIQGGLYNSISPGHKDHVVTNTEYTSTITFKPNLAKTSWSRKNGKFLDDIFRFEVYENGGTHYRIYKNEGEAKTVLYDTYDEELYDENDNLIESKVSQLTSFAVRNNVSSTPISSIENIDSYKKEVTTRKMRAVEDRNADLFKEGSRLLHLVDEGNVYYFFWITNATLTGANSYVEVQQIKVELQLN